MADFPGMSIDGVFYATAREAAEACGVTTQAIYLRAKRGWRDGDFTMPPHSRTSRHTNIEFRGEVWPSVAVAAKATGVTTQAIYLHLAKTNQIKGKA